MAVEPKVIDKIRKLLALATSSNENEAASAAAKAQELMQEYDLSMEAVSTKTDQRLSGIERSERQTLRKAGKPGGWKVALFNCVGATSDCWVYASDNNSRWYDSTGYLIGRSQDVEMAHYIFDYLVREMERLQDEYGKARWAELSEYAKTHGISTHEAERDFSSMKRHPLKAKDSWIRGAAETVITALHNAHRERQRSSEAANALVVHKEQQIRDWWAQQRGYANYAEYEAKIQSMPTTEAKPLTAAQQRKADEQSRRYWERQAAKEARERARQRANLDVEAYYDGRDAGKRIAVRPGVKGGTPASKPDLLS